MPRSSERALNTQVRVPEQSLRSTVTAIFRVMGESTEDAALAADVLVGADLRGADSHGVNALSSYVDEYRDGQLKPRATWRIVRDYPGAATIDGGRGHGIILGPKAMWLAIGKARKVGVAAVTLFNCGHSGAVGQYAMQAAREGMIGVCMTSSANPGVVPTYGAEPRFGTNPLAIAAPARHEAPYLFDAATSTVSGGKIQVYSRDSSIVPGG